MPSPLLIRGARQLLTARDAVEPRRGSRVNDLGIVPDGAVLINGTLIEQVGTTRRILNLNAARGATEIDASGCIVLPGFIDPLIELFSEHYTPAFVNRLAPSIMAVGTTAFRCSPVPRKAATLWESIRRLFADSTANTELNPRVALLFPIPAFTRRRSATPFPDSPLAIGTAFHHPDQPVYSMQVAIALATLHLGLSIEHALVAATTNAAHAIGRGHQLGAIEPGRQADLLILSVPDYKEIPYHLGVNLVRMVIKKGRKVIDRGVKK
jgi:imidazolonepropionase-like amidohydrolase